MVVPGSCSPSVAAGMAALQVFYNLSTGLWNTTDWWNAANALETTIDYSAITQTLTYRGNLFNTFEKHKHKNFLNPWFYDDQGWWALTWIKAYDLTGNQRYLDMAKTIFNDLKQGWDATCGGGVWWHKRRQYKNAITNELFLAVAAKLHLRSPNGTGPDSYLAWAQREWDWFKNTGMLNRDQLINDGLDDACQNNGKTTWTYNQGVILGGLVDMYKITNDASFLTQAHAIAEAAIKHLAPQGILQEPCELNDDCGNDGPQFKGIFMRNLAYLHQTSQKPQYKTFIAKNAASIWVHRDRQDQFGLRWASVPDQVNASRQSSAMDAINAAIAVGTRVTYQAETATLQQLTTETIGDRYHGAGYVGNWNRAQQSVKFQVEVACSGHYKLAFRYLAPSGNASRYVYVNGRSIVSNHVFPAANDWNHTSVSNVWLNAGKNEISVIFNAAKGSHNWLNLDEITLE